MTYFSAHQIQIAMWAVVITLCLFSSFEQFSTFQVFSKSIVNWSQTWYEYSLNGPLQSAEWKSKTAITINLILGIRNLFKEIIFSAQSKLYMNDSWKNLSKHNKRMTTNTYLSTLTGGRGSFLVIGTDCIGKC